MPSPNFLPKTNSSSNVFAFIPIYFISSVSISSSSLNDVDYYYYPINGVYVFLIGSSSSIGDIFLADTKNPFIFSIYLWNFVYSPWL